MTELNKGYWNLAVSRGCNDFGSFFSNRVIGDAFMSQLSFIALTKKEKTRQINLVSYLLQLRLVKRRLRGTREQQIYILINYLQYLCHIKKQRQRRKKGNCEIGIYQQMKLLSVFPVTKQFLISYNNTNKRGILLEF